MASPFNVGDVVLFGKYKNKRGKIVSFGTNHKGQATVEIEPIPKGRKSNKTLGLYKIWTMPTESAMKEALNEMLGGPKEEASHPPMPPEELLAKVKLAGLYVPTKYELDHLGRIIFKHGGVKYKYSWARLVKKLDIGMWVGGAGGESYHFHVLDKWQAILGAAKKIGMK